MIKIKEKFSVIICLWILQIAFMWLKVLNEIEVSWFTVFIPLYVIIVIKGVSAMVSYLNGENIK